MRFSLQKAFGLIILALLGTGSVPESFYSNPPTLGLAQVFEPGTILQDRNGDGHVDFVAARIVLPDSPTSDEVAAASAVAARLGFETAGLTLPLVVGASELPAMERSTLVVVGASNPRLPPYVASRIALLQPGQGAVVWSNGTLGIAGADSAGTRAAAEAFAARSPYLWDIIGRETGDTFDRIGRDLVGFLAAADVAVRQISFDELVFDKGRPEAVSATITATVTGGTAKAREVLGELKTRHLWGLDTDRLNYSSVAEISLVLVDGQARETVVIPRTGAPARLLVPERRTRAADAGHAQRFALSDLYTSNGLLADSDGDRIADSTGTLLVLPAGSVETASPGRGVAHMAARLGLESTGVAFPLIKLDTETAEPEREHSLVLFGTTNRLTEQLRRIGKASAPPSPGAGAIEMVTQAFGETPALVVTGGDRSGAEAAADYLARRAPYLWSMRRGAPTLEDVERGVRALLDGRTAAGQAALALAKLEPILDTLEGLDLEFVEVRTFLEEAAPEFDRYINDVVRRRLKAGRVEASSAGLRDPIVVFEEKPALEWEVDRFWRTFREKVVPRLRRGARVSLRLLVSESPELRRDLRDKIRTELQQTGAVAEEVTVLSAYKQGLSWLQDKVVPALKNRPVARIEVAWTPKAIDTSKPWVFHDEPARWLSELYPADDLLARELSLPLSAISFKMRSSAEAIYEVTATDQSGAVLYRDSFSPAFYERPWFDAFPDKARVTVTTGWIHVISGGETIIDERLETDTDLIWAYYQGTVLQKVYDRIKRTTDGRPTQEQQPFFHTLRFELKASEPDYRLGIDEELVSSLESIHDSVYYDGLEFFNLVVEAAGEGSRRTRSGTPGNILPWIHPERRGLAPQLVITYSENASRQPKMIVTYRVKGDEPRTEVRTFAAVELPPPSAYRIEVDGRGEGLARVGVRTTLQNAQLLPRLADLLDNLSRLQQAGVFPNELGFSDLGEVSIRLDAPGASTTRAYSAQPAARAAVAVQPHAPGQRLVGWQNVISPEESDRIAHTLGTLPGVTTYVAGRSYQGRPVSVMEIVLPMEATLVSRAKLITAKPVLSIMARQHANEVSSTSHVLRLAELLATDPEYRRYLQKMNVVIQPVTNPDGAALAYELQKLTPYHCLHAGRYTALGSDVTAERGNPYTLVTEALVLDKVFEDWLPDVQLNPHGYATHEQVQMFANYKRFRFRSYWIPRGWYTGINVPESPRYGDHRSVAYAMRDYIATEVSSDPEVRATNARMYDRYRRWTTRWQPHAYNLEVYRDTAIYFSRRGRTAGRAGADADITVFSAGTEAMDETAQGDWLDLVSRMGFGFLRASVRLLDEAQYNLYRLEEEREGRITLSVTRPRPLKPGPRDGISPSSER